MPVSKIFTGKTFLLNDIEYFYFVKNSEHPLLLLSQTIPIFCTKLGTPDKIATSLVLPFSLFQGV